jgi:hypothetical protein
MDRKRRSRRFAAGPAIAMIVVGMIGAPPASASAPRPSRLALGAAISSVVVTGTYEATLEGRSTSELVITRDAGVSRKEGTFSLTDFGDSGNWVISGHIVALLVTSATAGEGTIMIGTVTDTGITPGVWAIPGSGAFAWSAIRTVGAVDSTSSRLMSKPRTSLAPSAAAGSYTATFVESGNTLDLTLTNDVISRKEGTFAFSTLPDDGNWVVMGKHLAMGVTSGSIDAGIVFLGKINATGISSLTKPGSYGLPFIGVHPWYATKP